GDTQLHGARASNGEQCGSQQRHRCLRAWRSALPIAHWAAALCRWSNLRDDQVIAGYRAAATAPVEYESRSRSQHDLPQVPRERSKTPLFFRSRAGRRSRTLAQARTNSGATHRLYCPCQKMGAEETSYCRVDWIAGCFGCSHGLEYMEERN